MSDVVFITGASSGFGAAIARRFARDGARLVLAARRRDRLDALVTELAALGASALAVPLDVRDRGAVQRAVASLPAGFAEIDVLVNDAGGALGLEPAHEANLDDWDAMVDTNVKGLLYVTRAVLPGMVARDRGHVINLGSVAGSYPYPGGNVYGATKAFVEQFSLNLRADLAGKRIRVTNIEPGMAETEFSLVRFKGDEARARAAYQGFPALTPDDIAESVRWVAGLPAHVNVNRLELMSVMQSFAGFSIKRT
jgi:NADP-dependent 3-hydroxy acid dehydrogenase YdfG